tara:strand:- start:260 stop:958 length:699 start_codon:yes stop_codon:yes gene_type:complete
MPIKALLLAAGLGTRLRPLTLETPKCLVEINNIPLLEYWLRKLEDLNCNEVIINTHYLSGKVENFLKKREVSMLKIKRFHEVELLGTAGTLISNINFFSGSTGLLIHADNFTKDSLQGLIAAHSYKPSNCLITMLTFVTDCPYNCGIVEVDNNGIVINFHEKVSNPPGNLANGAVYVFDSEFLNWLSLNHPLAHDFSKEVLPNLIGKIFTWKINKPYIDIGNPEALKFSQNI